MLTVRQKRQIYVHIYNKIYGVCVCVYVYIHTSIVYFIIKIHAMQRES